MEKRGGKATSRKEGTGEPTSGNSEGSAIWGRWTGSQYEQRGGPNSMSSSTVWAQEGSEEITLLQLVACLYGHRMCLVLICRILIYIMKCGRLHVHCKLC